MSKMFNLTLQFI